MNREKLQRLLSTESLAQRKPFRSLATLEWYQPPEVKTVWKCNETAQPVYTLVLPIYNQETILAELLRTHDQQAVLPYNLVAILDCCTDRSAHELQATLMALGSRKLVHAAIIATTVPFFETACDNLGFLCCETEFVIATQPDLFIKTPAYDRRLISVLRNSQVSCVSGRCGHALGELAEPTLWNRFFGPATPLRGYRVGLLGTSIESAGTTVDDTQNTAFFCETVNRGPIAFRLQDLIQLNYLDQENFFLGNDDHDWNLRQWLLSGRLPAYVPLRIASKLSWGSTRKARDPLNERIYQALLRRVDNSTLKRFMPFYRPYCKATRFTFGALEK